MAEYFVATNGDSGNTGAIDSPWDLASTLKDNATIAPGDTVYIRGGTYVYPTRTGGVDNNGFEVNLQGAQNNYITIKPYPGERATIDGGICSDTQQDPQYLIIRDLELIVSEVVNHADRVVTTADLAGYAEIGGPWGGCDFTNGHAIKLVNNVIHANAQGIGFWKSVSGDSEIYSNIIYDNGWIGPDRYHGHGIYTQNESVHGGWKYIRNNLILENYRNSMQAYGSSTAPIFKFHVADNICGVSNENYDGRMLIGGGATGADWVAINNFSYHVSLQLGYNGQGADNVVCTGNTIWSKIEFIELTNFTQGNNWEWYWRYDALPNVDGVEEAFPATPVYTLNPNAYDTRRAHLGIHAFNAEENVAVDMSNFLRVGDYFELRDPTDFWGTAVVTGTYAGGDVPVPLNGSEFKAYLVIKNPAVKQYKLIAAGIPFVITTG